MLKKAQVLCAFHLQAAKHSLNVLFRKPLATLMTVIVLAITLALPMLLGIIIHNFKQLTHGWQERGHISLFLKPGLSSMEQKVFLQKVHDMNGIGHVSLTSPEEGLAELTQQEGMHDIMRYLPENPLPAVIEVIPALTIDSSAKLDLLYEELEGLPQVTQAKLDREWINKWHLILGFAANFATALMFLLGLAVLLIIGNTLSLAIHNRHEEIQILKLIGATDPFITRPFLYMGLWYGMAGAIVALVLVNIFILSLRTPIHQLMAAYQMHYSLSVISWFQVLLLILFAIILGLLGASLSIKRQLASIEP